MTQIQTESTVSNMIPSQRSSSISNSNPSPSTTNESQQNGIRRRRRRPGAAPFPRHLPQPRVLDLRTRLFARGDLETETETETEPEPKESPATFQLNEPITIERVRKHLKNTHQRLEMLSDTVRKTRRLKIDPSIPMGLGVSAAISYAITNIFDRLGEKMEADPFYLGMVSGLFVKTKQRKREAALLKQTIASGKDISDLIRSMRHIFEDSITPIYFILKEKPELREQLTEDDYRLILESERYSAQIDKKLRKDAAKIDRDAERALDFSAHRKQARNYLKRMVDRFNIHTNADYLTMRRDQQPTELNYDNNFVEDVFSSLQSPSPSETQTDNEQQTPNRRILRKPQLPRFLRRQRAEIIPTETTPTKPPLTPQEIAMRKAIPRLKTGNLIKLLKAVIGPDNGEFQYPATLKRGLGDRSEQLRIQLAQHKSKELIEQVMELLKDQHRILKNQHKLDRRTERYANLPQGAIPAHLSGVAGAALFYAAISESLGSVRDYLLSYVPENYGWLAGGIFGYTLWHAMTGPVQKYATQKVDGKNLAARSVSLWLLYDKQRQFLEIVRSHPELVDELKGKNPRLSILLNKIDNLAKRQDKQTFKEMQAAREDPADLEAYVTQLTGAQQYLSEMTDYGFLRPTVSPDEFLKDPEAEPQEVEITKAGESPCTNEPSSLEAEASKNGVYAQKVKYFYEALEAGISNPELESTFASILEDATHLLTTKFEKELEDLGITSNRYTRENCEIERELV